MRAEAAAAAEEEEEEEEEEDMPTGATRPRLIQALALMCIALN
jgi:hypothetical protein